jgi:hypothetical protein
VTHRKEISDKFWFATYAEADEFVIFPRGDIHVHEVVRYANYRSSDSQLDSQR